MLEVIRLCFNTLKSNTFPRRKIMGSNRPLTIILHLPVFKSAKGIPNNDSEQKPQKLTMNDPLFIEELKDLYA
jgi:hypothetical protein